MKRPVQFDGIAEAALPPRPLHLAIGMFDGVHLGHQAVIETAVQSARRNGGLPAVLTFWPHPSVLFRPDNPTALLMEPEAKLRVLGGLGVEAVISQRFDGEFSRIEAEDFLGTLRRCLPHLAAVYVGENWKFGRGRIGDVALLVAQGRRHGVAVFSIARICHDGEPISSTRIRGLFAGGKLDEVNALLGRTFSSEGPVIPGKKLGRTLGFPTLNMGWGGKLRPAQGVYAVRVSGEGGEERLPAVANFGVRPTVATDTAPTLEIHVLCDCPFREGDRLVVEWHRFLRPEIKFADVTALRTQISADCAEAARSFGMTA